MNYYKEGSSAQLHCVASYADDKTTLCGQKWRLWVCEAIDFMENVAKLEPNDMKPPICQECLDHPDLPLLLLGTQ